MEDKEVTEKKREKIRIIILFIITITVIATAIIYNVVIK